MEITKCMEFYREFVLLVKDQTDTESIKKLCFKYDEYNEEWVFVINEASFYTNKEIEKIHTIIKNINQVSALSKELQGLEKI